MRPAIHVLNLFLVGHAAAQCGGFSGGAIPIPDLGTYEYHITCEGVPNTTVGVVRLEIRITHPRQGDLVVRLRHDLSGVTATLMNRPGTEDGLSTEGYTSANLGGNGFFRFSDAASTAYAVPPVGYYPRPGVNNPSGDFRPSVDPLSTFTGLAYNSSWTIMISDAAPGATGSVNGIILEAERAEPWTCYPNCDHSYFTIFLNINDFVCFQSQFATGDSAANCDRSTAPPTLTINDFICFMSAFAAGCSAP